MSFCVEQLLVALELDLRIFQLGPDCPASVAPPAPGRDQGEQQIALGHVLALAEIHGWMMPPICGRTLTESVGVTWPTGGGSMSTGMVFYHGLGRQHRRGRRGFAGSALGTAGAKNQRGPTALECGYLVNNIFSLQYIAGFTRVMDGTGGQWFRDTWRNRAENGRHRATGP